MSDKKEQKEEKMPFLYDIIIVGDSGVGKSTLIKIFETGEFNEYIEPSSKVYTIVNWEYKLDDEKAILRIIVIPGEENIANGVESKYYVNQSNASLILNDIKN